MFKKISFSYVSSNLSIGKHQALSR